jgi:polar amino acid transport system substrate-binding protein
MIASRALLPLALGGCLLLGACGLPSLVQPGLTASAARPTSAAAASPPPAPAPSTAPAPTCADNGKASLRPQGSVPAPGSFPAGSFMKTIYDRGKIVIGVSKDTWLFGYVDPGTNQLQGFDIDIAREVGKALFGDYNHIELKVTQVANRIPALKDGSVDLVSWAFTANCARWQQIDFSTVYYNSGQTVMVAKNSAYHSLQDLTGKRVCAATGSTSIESLAKSSAKPIPVGVPDQSDCLVLLQRGEVDAISTDEALLLGLAAQDPTVHIVGDKFTDEPYALGISQAHPEFVRFVNAVLDRMRSDGTWAAIYNKWLGKYGASATPPPASYKD